MFFNEREPEETKKIVNTGLTREIEMYIAEMSNYVGDWIEINSITRFFSGYKRADIEQSLMTLYNQNRIKMFDAPDVVMAKEEFLYNHDAKEHGWDPLEDSFLIMEYIVKNKVENFSPYDFFKVSNWKKTRRVDNALSFLLTDKKNLTIEERRPTVFRYDNIKMTEDDWKRYDSILIDYSFGYKSEYKTEEEIIREQNGS